MLTLLDPEAPRSAEPLRVLDDLRQTALEAAANAPVLVVLEDMHWADRSTQDFAAALSRTARGGLLLVLTFRSDELHRRHPFRKTLVEIGRTVGSRRIDLGGLSGDDIAGLVAARTEGPPDPAVVSTVLGRSEGNPLYAEELLAADQEGVPGHLSDLLLARIDALDQGPRALLRVASVNGTRLDTETLAELAGLDQTRMEGHLREALDANVLRQAAGSLEFRHPLLREAAYDDLMPDERTRTHARLAEILQAGVDAESDPRPAILSRLAFHWNAAHDLPRTLTASVRAGLAARRLGAAEAIPQLERALSLWDRVPDAETLAGHPRAELVVLMGDAAGDQGDLERWHALVRTAVDMLGPDPDRLLASRVYSALAQCSFHTVDTIGAQEAVRLAVEYAGDSPTEELAWALGAQAQYLNRQAQFAASVAAAQRAIDVARRTGCLEAELDALYVGCLSLEGLGHIAAALEGMAQANDVARAAGMVGNTLDEYLPLAYMDSGQVDRGLSVAGEGFDEGMALGLPKQATMCGGAALQALLWRGRLDEAEQRLEELTELGLPASSGHWRSLRADLLLARGDAAAATPLVRETAADTRAASRKPWDVEALTELALAMMLDDLPGALETARSCLAQLDDTDSPLVAAGAARIGFQALCLGRSTLWARTDELRDGAARHLESRAGRPHRRVAPDVPRGPARACRGLRRQVRRRTGRRPVPGGDRAGAAVRRLLRPRAAPEPGHRAARPRRPGRGPRAARRVLAGCPRHGCPRPRAPRPPARHPHPRSAAPVGNARGTVEPADTAGTRGPRPPRHRRHQQVDRRDAVRHREDRQRARVEPAGQARRHQPRGSRRPRPTARRMTGRRRSPDGASDHRVRCLSVPASLGHADGVAASRL